MAVCDKHGEEKILIGRKRCCRSCKAEAQRRWKRNSGYVHTGRDGWSYRRGDMPPKVVCALCPRRTNLVYDHDHVTLRFRGVLCASCNKALGVLGDQPEALARALAYLAAATA